MSALPVRGIDAAQHILSIPNPDGNPITLHDLHLILFIAECTVRRQHGIRLTSDTFINQLGYPYASSVCEILGPNDDIDRYHEFLRNTYIGGTLHTVTPPVQDVLNTTTRYYFHEANTDEIEELTANSPFVRRTRDGEEIVLPLP